MFIKIPRLNFFSNKAELFNTHQGQLKKGQLKKSSGDFSQFGSVKNNVDTANQFSQVQFENNKATKSTRFIQAPEQPLQHTTSLQSTNASVYISR